jgi:hypothetical protein
MTNFFAKLGVLLRDLYFIRFSAGLWLFVPILCALNESGLRTLTSGVVTPETWQQYLCVAFFMVSASFVSLISARVTLINGPDRWSDAKKDKEKAEREENGWQEVLKTLLVNNIGKYEWTAFWLSLVNTFAVYIYFVFNGRREQVSVPDIVIGVLAGSGLAAIFWGVANAWYYLAYQPPESEKSKATALGKNAARTLLFPRSFFKLRTAANSERANTLEDLSMALPVGWLQKISNFFPESGFRDADTKLLYEGQLFTLIAAGVFIGLYAVIWPYASPIPEMIFSLVVSGLALVVGIWVIRIFLAKKSTVSRRMKAMLVSAVIVFLMATMSLYFLTSSERFPVLAAVLIMMISLCWILSGVAFLVDRYRIPVFTVLLIAMLLPRLPGWDPFHISREEHYLSTAIANPNAPEPPTPAAVLDAMLPDPAATPDAPGDKPLLIVTATGGGLHASAWTAAVLANLEKEFSASPQAGGPGSFHQHLLLASTVSGGSVGLLSYLRELQEQKPDFDGRMLMSAQCSGLEAIGWGIIYYDLPKAVLPFFSYMVPRSGGEDDLTGHAIFKDRTWALRQAFVRNANNSYCEDAWDRDRHAPRPFWNLTLFERNISDYKKNMDLAGKLTLRNLLPAGDRKYPAFTMNTTAYENGERFLSANYVLPESQTDGGPNYRARSFLGTFGVYPDPSLGSPKFADLPLATGAQMSATFPYVSSAARVPTAIDPSPASVHFVDGGYFDNDGTSSVIEFLRYALAQPKSVEFQPKNCAVGVKDPKEAGEDLERCRQRLPVEDAHLKSIMKKLELQADGATGLRKLRIVLVEIRNSGDVSAPWVVEKNDAHSDSGGPGNLLTQLGAPVIGLWQAGHESVTKRTRAALAQLEHALYGRLEIHRVMIADFNAQDRVHTDPLSWSLTPIQRREVQDSAENKPNCTPPDDCKVSDAYREVLDWFNKSRVDWDKADSNWPE